MRLVPPVAERVAPGHEEVGPRACRRDLVAKVTRERVRAVTPLLLGKREQPALLLEHDDVPFDVSQQLRQPPVLVGLAEAPARRRVLDGEDRGRAGIAGREVVYERGQ